MSFQLRDGASYTLLQYVLEGIIDLSVARTPLNLESVDSLPLGREPMLAVSAPPDVLPGEGDLPLEALLGRPLILYRRYEEQMCIRDSAMIAERAEGVRVGVKDPGIVHVRALPKVRH